MGFRVLLVGGGSGGHVYPLVAVAQALKKARPDVQVKLMGDGPFVARAAKEAGLPYTGIVAPKLRRYASVHNIMDTVMAPLALAQAFWKLFWYMPDAVFAKGGYTSVFPCIAARVFMIPVYLHESDSVPGMGNRLLAKRAKLIFTAFEKAAAALAPNATVLVGNPVRPGLGGADKAASLAAFQLQSGKPTVLVIGGSQGAGHINKVVMDGLVQMAQDGWQVIHQTGDANYKAVSEEAAKIIKDGEGTWAAAVQAQYRAYPFLDEGQLAAAYAACDVAVTRASANVLTELSLSGKPMVMVPLPGSAQDHQLENAAELSKYGNIIMDDANLTPVTLVTQLGRLMQPETYAKVSAATRAFARPDAADKIAQVILKG